MNWSYTSSVLTTKTKDYFWEVVIVSDVNHCFSKGQAESGNNHLTSKSADGLLVNESLKDKYEFGDVMRSNKKVLFCIVGKSASGKDTLCRLASQRLGYGIVCSSTDRPMRSGEVDGREHYFHSKEHMTTILETEHILAKTQIGEYRYCATVESLEPKTKFYIVDPNGVHYIQEHADELGIYPLVIYIDTPDEVRCERARLRGDLPDVFLERCSAEDAMFNQFRESLLGCKDYVVVHNNNLEVAYVDFASTVLGTLYFFNQI